MYAVVESGSKQYRVKVGDHLVVDRLSAEADAEHVFNKVLLVSDDSGIKVGTPVVEGATVTAKVVSHDKGDKVITFKYSRRQRTRRKVGFRASLTTLEITAINA